MDFAKRQLEQMGWSEGKGLGKNEDGIIAPIKMRCQKDSVGLGYDRTTGINTDLWFATIDKNIKEARKKRRTLKESDDEKNQPQATESYETRNFVKSSSVFKTIETSVDTNKKRKKKKKITEEDTNDHKSKIDLYQVFKDSKGATCHRSAHVGLNLSGKLDRIKQQEMEFKFKQSKKS